MFVGVLVGVFVGVTVLVGVFDGVGAGLIHGPDGQDNLNFQFDPGSVEGSTYTKAYSIVLILQRLTLAVPEVYPVVGT